MFEVYVHVPFCLKRCGYCDFNTYTATDLGGGASRANYANMAIAEMKLVKAWQTERGINEPAVSSVFFGGGTPTVLPAHDLGRMLEAIQEIWGIETGAEVTTEANPDTVDQSYLAELKASGFTRVSFGMQSAVPHVLNTLDRTHTPHNVTANVAAAKAVGLEASVDLIYGAPGESMDDWRTSVQAALALDVDHVSAYALTVEPTTKMGRQIARGDIAKPDDDDEAAKYELADDLFSQAGLQWYEISNWARPGHESRHNLGYWRNVDWAGIGPGAHSHYRTSDAGAWRESPSALGVAGAKNDEGFMRTAEIASLHDDEAVADESAAGNVTVSVPADSRDAEDLMNASEYPAQHRAQSHCDEPHRGNPRRSDPSQFGVRSWDIAHPRTWADAISAERVPWQGSEAISHDENLEETVMLGLRLREGLDIRRIDEASGKRLDPGALRPLTAAGLVSVSEGRITATRRGRLLNDTVISSVLNCYGL